MTERTSVWRKAEEIEEPKQEFLRRRFTDEQFQEFAGFRFAHQPGNGSVVFFDGRVFKRRRNMWMEDLRPYMEEHMVYS